MIPTNRAFRGGLGTWRPLVRLVWLAFAILLSTAARADPTLPPPERWSELAGTPFQHFGRDQELPNPGVQALAEDGDGFIWAGTYGGLARWDGYHFRAYRPKPGDPDALPDNYVRVLHTDPQGRLWIGTNAGGLARYDRERDRFVTYPVGPGGLSHSRVYAITDDGQGGLWVGTDGGLDHLDPKTDAIKALPQDDQDPGSPPGIRVRSLLRDHTGRLWVGLLTGLARLEAGARGLTPVALPTPAGVVPRVWSLFEAPDGRIWVGTAESGAYVLDPATGEARPVQESGTAPSSLDTEWVLSIAAVGEEIWLGTYGTGLVALDPATGRTRRIRHDPILPDSLATDGVTSLMVDRSGSLWLGTDNGLDRFIPNHGAITTVFGASSQADGVSAADVEAVLPRADGRVWLGFTTGGIDIIDPTSHRIAQLAPDPLHPETSLPKDAVFALTEIGQDQVVVATSRGFYRVEGQGRAVSRLTVPGRASNAAGSSVLVDAGLLWLGGVDGLWAVAPDQPTNLVFGPEESAGLTDQYVSVIARGAAGDLWVGTQNGLNRLDPATHRIERIPANPADPQALAAGSISSLLVDRPGRLWVGTLGGGIAVMTGRDADGKPRFRRLGVAEGLPNLVIDKLLLAGDGSIWASTDGGMAVINPDTLAVRALHRAEGVPFSSYWVGAGAMTPEGELIFGGTGGLTIIRPDRLQPWTYHPPVVVTDARIGGKPVPVGRLDGTGSPAPLTLTPEANSLTVEFAALDLTAPERNRYAYRLDGFDPTWIETDAMRRLAAYTNLPPGSYTLRLRGSNHDGIWTERDLAVPVIVLPAWYQTLWFKLALALAGMAAIAGLVQIRTAVMRQRHRILEREVAERTADLAISSESLRVAYGYLERANRELGEANAELARLAHHDPLTGLANRRRFFQATSEMLALARRYDWPCSVMMVDLDHFKRINDSFGHGGGDATLQAAARCLAESVREVDVVARIGGEEFAVFLPETRLSEACLVAERFRGALAALEIPHDGAIIQVTASIGVAAWVPAEPGIEPALDRADAALYRVKQGGRNGVAAETPAIEVGAARGGR